MTLVVVKVFADLQEAQVAASALRAAGLDPILPDAGIASTYWPLQFAFGGVRLCTPPKDAEEAAAILSSVEAGPAGDFRVSPQAGMRTAGALALMFIGGAGGGWLAARRGGLSRAQWMGVLLVWVALIAVCAVLFTARGLVHAQRWNG